jgi:single-stranded-DNA-specific exonuclease
VLGIVAAKLVDRFYRPVVLISIRNGIGKGSGRSIPGFHMYEGIKKASDHLERFGGHEMAAGLQIREDRIDAFREAFETIVTENTRREDFFPKIDIDLELSLNDITPKLVDELGRLQPFGQGNSEPIFMARNVSVVFSRVVGSRHRQFRLKPPGPSKGAVFNAIQFNIDPASPPPTFLEQIAFKLRWNHWNGNRTIQLIIEAT